MDGGGFQFQACASKITAMSLANVLHYAHRLRLKQNFKSADPTGNRTWRIGVKLSQ